MVKGLIHHVELWRNSSVQHKLREEKLKFERMKKGEFRKMLVSDIKHNRQLLDLHNLLKLDSIIVLLNGGKKNCKIATFIWQP